ESGEVDLICCLMASRVGGGFILISVCWGRQYSSRGRTGSQGIETTRLALGPMNLRTALVVFRLRSRVLPYYPHSLSHGNPTCFENCECMRYRNDFRGDDPASKPTFRMSSDQR